MRWSGVLRQMDAGRDGPGHGLEARRILHMVNLWGHDYVLPLLGLRAKHLRPCRPESPQHQEHGERS